MQTIDDTKNLEQFNTLAQMSIGLNGKERLIPALIACKVANIIPSAFRPATVSVPGGFYLILASWENESWHWGNAVTKISDFSDKIIPCGQWGGKIDGSDVPIIQVIDFETIYKIISKFRDGQNFLESFFLFSDDRVPTGRLFIVMSFLLGFPSLASFVAKLRREASVDMSEVITQARTLLELEFSVVSESLRDDEEQEPLL